MEILYFLAYVIVKQQKGGYMIEKIDNTCRIYNMVWFAQYGDCTGLIKGARKIDTDI